MLKKYENVLLLIADGQNDQLGAPNGTLEDWGGTNATKELNSYEFISVRDEFSLDAPIGRASNFEWVGTHLYATLEIIDEFDATNKFPCVGATISGKTPRTPDASSPKFKLFCIGICSGNSDKRIPALQEKP